MVELAIRREKYSIWFGFERRRTSLSESTWSRSSLDVDVLAVLYFQIPCSHPGRVVLRLLVFIQDHFSPRTRTQIFAIIIWTETKDSTIQDGDNRVPVKDEIKRNHRCYDTYKESHIRVSHLVIGFHT